MRIMDVQKFTGEQFSKFRERRVSQYTRFLDKSVEFYTYFAINKVLSTTEIGNMNIDSYIGKDSPVRYNKINNLPMYGFPRITSESEYEVEQAGLNMDSFTGELIMLSEIIEPCEGDCFILNSYNQNRYFIVTNVANEVLRSRPYYILQFVAGIPDYLPQLQSQVVDEFNALFDNIGTEDRVVISNKEYSQLAHYTDIYKDLMSYYLNEYFVPKLTLFELDTDIPPETTLYRYTDKFLAKFMTRNRVIVMDNLTKGSLMLDYNALYDKDDFMEYKRSIYNAIETKSIKRLAECRYISMTEIKSPFALITGETDVSYYTSQYFLMEKAPEPCSYNLPYDNSEIFRRYNQKDESYSDDAHSRVMSIITKYLHDVIIDPGYFYDLYGSDGSLDPLEEYMYLPIILFIISKQIDGLTKRTNILYR